jgi:hypothetical protein
VSPRILTCAMRDRNGVRLCHLGCGPDAPMVGGSRDHACKMATRKCGKPGETVFTPPLPGKCRMFYDEKGQPT